MSHYATAGSSSMSAEARPTTSLRVTLETPRDRDRVSSFLNIRVKDIEAVYADLERPGCSIPDAPKHHQYEIRCYIRDPDGHLIEVGQPRTQSGTGRPRIDFGQWRTGATQWAHTSGMRSRGTGTTRALPGSPFNQPPAVAIVARYAISDRVSHDRYGLGTVVGTENGNAAVLVEFGPKVLRVALPTTKMVKL